jgi:hypothetical protein
MKSPLPILAIGAAFLLLKSKDKKGDQCDPLNPESWKKGHVCIDQNGVFVYESKDNIFKMTADSALPIPKGPYIQIISTYPGIDVAELEPAIRPIAESNMDIRFVISGPAGADRLHMAQSGIETTPDVFEVMGLAAESEQSIVKGMGGSDATLTDLQGIVSEVVESIRAPMSQG